MIADPKGDMSRAKTEPKDAIVEPKRQVLNGKEGELRFRNANKLYSTKRRMCTQESPSLSGKVQVNWEKKFYRRTPEEAIEVGVWKKVLVERELRGGEAEGSSRKQQETVEVGV